MKEQVLQSIRENKIVAILRKVDTEKLLPVVNALYDGGIRCLEITFDQESKEGIATTKQQISMLSKEFAGRMHIGAGTVMTPEQVQMAKEAGASFVISPNVNVQVIEKTKELDMVSMPGAMTPTEIAYAYELGADLVKVFPASDLGADYIKAVRGPMAYIPMVAVGGIKAGNIEEFLKAGCCGFGVGGKLVNKEAIANCDYSALTNAAKEIVAAVNEQ